MTIYTTHPQHAQENTNRASIHWPVLCAIAVGLACTVTVWRIIQKNEVSRIDRITKLVAAAVTADATADSEAWVRELERFAKFGVTGHLSKADWKENAQLYIQHHPGTLSIELHGARKERWRVDDPDETIEEEVDQTTEQRATASAALINKPVSFPIKTSAGRDGWITVVPLNGDASSRLFLVASFDLIRSLDSMSDNVKGLGFSISAGERGQSLSLLTGASSDYEKEFSQSVDVDVAGTIWQLDVWPRAAALDEMQSSTASTILVGGILLSFMIALTVFFAQTSARRATFLERANERLLDENRERQRSQEALRASHARFAGILEISTDAVISTDEQHRIILYNCGAETLFGYTAGEVLGHPLSVLIPERLREAHSRHVQRFNASHHQTLIMSEQSQLFGLRKDGTEIRLVGSVAKLEIDGEKIFTSMFRDVTESVQAAEQLRKAHDELEVRVLERTADLEAANAALQAEVTERMRADQSLRELSGRLLRLQDEERRRIARELHDGSIQNLAALALTLNLVRDDTAQLSPSIYESLSECLRLIEQSTGDLRTISYLLHPPVLEELGLTRTLQNYVDGFSRRSGIPVALQVSEPLGHLPSDVELTVFRIVQEALCNIHRHSNSQTAAIRLLRSVNKLLLEIADQGTGIPDITDGVGVGIAGMRERVRLLGGELDIQSSSSGTTIRVHLATAERSSISGPDHAPVDTANSAA